jgi:hypothetical protein
VIRNPNGEKEQVLEHPRLPLRLAGALLEDLAPHAGLEVEPDLGVAWITVRGVLSSWETSAIKRVLAARLRASASSASLRWVTFS